MKVGDGIGNHRRAIGKFKRTDVYGDFHICVPSPVHNALKRICEARGITLTSVYTELIEGFLRDNMNPEDYDSLMAFVDEYYPPYRSKEVVAFWERYLGISDEE